jgi:hypothetical protein
MAFIVLRRSRNTKNYYLVESYRDAEGRSRKRTLCYLGREQDGTDTLAKAVAHWGNVLEQCRRELRTAKGSRRDVLRRRRATAEARHRLLTNLMAEQARITAAAEAERKRQERLAEEAVQWQAFDRLRQQPSEENARAAKRAFVTLAKRHHPDQGGTHQDFLRLKDAYDRALAVWRRFAA